MKNQHFYEGQIEVPIGGRRGFVHTEHLKVEIFLEDRKSMNRAMHGDTVVAELLPFHQWTAARAKAGKFAGGIANSLPIESRIVDEEGERLEQDSAEEEPKGEEGEDEWEDESSEEDS